MMVTLTDSGAGQFGEHGPKGGDTGRSVEVKKDQDGDVYVVVLFEQHRGYYNVPLQYLLHPNHENTETVWSTQP